MSAYVYVLTHTRKHGSFVSVYRSLHGALGAARQMAVERASDDWEDADEISKLTAIEHNDKAVDYFNTIEQELSYSEMLAVARLPLWD